MIVIAGDSWGCGCWDTEQTVYHRGLEQYLYNDGHQVINLSEGGLSLEFTAQRLKDFLSIQKPLFVKDAIKVFVFQTEWHRGKESLQSSIVPMMSLDSSIEDYNRFENIGDDHKIMASFYGILSHLANKHNMPIYLIGGCSDTIWIDDFESHYPGVTIVCQSFTNLLVNNNHRIDTPVHSVRFPADLLNKEHCVDLAILGQQREQIWKDNPEWMWPDGCHPNHLAHEKLYSHLKKENVI